MTATESCPAFSAFEKQLKTLCLREFPCGSGSWRRTEKKAKPTVRRKTRPIKSHVDLAAETVPDKVDSQFVVTLKDYGPEHEKVETLQEYVGSKFSPWHLDYSWSQEAKELRDISVKSPWLIDNTFVLNYFKTLRIVDRNVTEVDPDILQFKNLEELTLSANFIKNIDAKNLPPSLQVLELCANDISDISALCIDPPRLSHLGLGFNRISFIGDYITGDYWPSLLSLDLSHNNLSDLLDVVRKLGTLPKLRNLILQGNPLSLIPGYRGYTIDSLRKLSVLDDIRISADEKHHFKGLARRREYILDEAKLTLEVTQMTGVPVPEEIKNPEEQPEFPIIERTYFVQFMFLEEMGAKAEILNMIDNATAMSGTVPDTERQQLGATSDMQSEFGGSQGWQSAASMQERNVYFNSKPDLKSVENVMEVCSEVPPTAMEGEAADQQLPVQDTPFLEMSKPQLALVPIKTESVTWAEEMEMNWSSTQVRDDLQNLRDFFKQGMEISVVEQLVLCNPLEDEDGDAVSGTGSAMKKSKDDKKGDKKGKQPEPPKKEEKKKKKKEPEVELRREPPQLTTLATFHVPLEDFLDGEYEYESVLTQGTVEVASTVRTESPELGKKEGKKDRDSKDKKGKPASAAKKDAKDKGKDAGKGSKSVKEVDKKDAKKGKTPAPGPPEEEGEEVPPPPLEVHLAVRLHHWKTAMDSMREDDDRSKTGQE